MAEKPLLAKEPDWMTIVVVVSDAAQQCQEWTVNVAADATLADALSQCVQAGAKSPWLEKALSGKAACGVWGRAQSLDQVLQPHDRVEVYRPLLVDPKVARRERFAKQGARSAGLFSRRRPAGKQGY